MRTRGEQPNSVFCVPGTHGIIEDGWYPATSTFSAFLRTCGFLNVTIRSPWSTALGGVFDWLLPQSKQHLIWSYGGDNLVDDLDAVPLRDRFLITHSHGVQPALFAAARIPVRGILAIAPPVRMDVVKRLGGIKAGRMIAVACRYDRWQWLGSLGDTVFRTDRAHPFATHNLTFDGFGHSGLFTEPRAFEHVWPKLLTLLKESPIP